MNAGGWIAVVVWTWFVIVLLWAVSFDVRRWLRARRARQFARRMEEWMRLPGAVDRRTPR